MDGFFTLRGKSTSDIVPMPTLALLIESPAFITRMSELTGGERDVRAPRRETATAVMSATAAKNAMRAKEMVPFICTRSVWLVPNLTGSAV